jgi:hypothetical protein
MKEVVVNQSPAVNKVAQLNRRARFPARLARQRRWWTPGTLRFIKMVYFGIAPHPSRCYNRANFWLTMRCLRRRAQEVKWPRLQLN